MLNRLLTLLPILIQSSSKFADQSTSEFVDGKDCETLHVNGYYIEDPVLIFDLLNVINIHQFQKLIHHRRKTGFFTMKPDMKWGHGSNEKIGEHKNESGSIMFHGKNYPRIFVAFQEISRFAPLTITYNNKQFVKEKLPDNSHDSVTHGLLHTYFCSSLSHNFDVKLRILLSDENPFFRVSDLKPYIQRADLYNTYSRKFVEDIDVKDLEVTGKDHLFHKLLDQKKKIFMMKFFFKCCMKYNIPNALMPNEKKTTLNKF